jgi:hypothetical protein
LGQRLLRLKGNIDFGRGLQFVELAGETLVERTACEGLPGHTAFSAIGWQITRSELQTRFEQTLAASDCG